MEAVPSESLWRQLVRIVVAWEKLRLIYNAVLVVLVLGVIAIAAPAMATSLELWAGLLAGAIVANLLFLAGPGAEIIAALFTRYRVSMRTILFLAGLLLSALASFITTIDLLRMVN